MRAARPTRRALRPSDKQTHTYERPAVPPNFRRHLGGVSAVEEKKANPDMCRWCREGEEEE